MSGSAVTLNNLVSNNTNQSLQAANKPAVTPEQPLTQPVSQASQGDVYGPPYILSISVTSGNGTSGASEQQEFKADFQQLSQALQNGNLSAAQQAFSALSQIPAVQAALQAQQNGSSNNPFAKALNQIGSELQSGNLSGAQQAFSALQQLASSTSGSAPHVGGHHHHHGGGGGSEASSSSSASGSSTSGTSSANGSSSASGTSSTNGSSSATNAFTILESFLASVQSSTSPSNPAASNTVTTAPNVNIQV